MSVTCRLHVGYIPHPLQTLTLCTRYEPHTKRRLPLALPAHTPRPARRRPSSPQTLRVLDHILLEREELLQELLSDSHLHLSMTCVRMRVAPPQNVSPQLLHWSWGDVAWSREMVTESQSAPYRRPVAGHRRLAIRALLAVRVSRMVSRRSYPSKPGRGARTRT